MAAVADIAALPGAAAAAGPRCSVVFCVCTMAVTAVGCSCLQQRQGSRQVAQRDPQQAQRAVRAERSAEVAHGCEQSVKLSQRLLRLQSCHQHRHRA